jgi:hypothetical protein
MEQPAVWKLEHRLIDLNKTPPNNRVVFLYARSCQGVYKKAANILSTIKTFKEWQQW